MDLIQQKLRELEMLAHQSHMPMGEVMNLVERQFVLAAIQRTGSVRRASFDLRKRPCTIYRAMVRLKLARRARA